MNLILNYEGFEQYLVELYQDPAYGCGIHYIFRFDNHYGASVIKHPGSYGHEEDLWELAVLWFISDDKWDIEYNTPITDDVIGYQNDEEIRNLLNKIKNLNPA